MIPLLTSVFVASLLGGTHCVAMCGGFVCFYAGGTGDARARRLSHVAYHGGRLAAYAALGALAGGLGAGIESIGAWAGVERAAAVVAGALMVLWGGAALVRAGHDASSPLLARPPRLLGVLSRGALAAAHAWPPPARALTVGLLSALLPCGWLFAFVTTAAGTAHPVSGAFAMAAFWAGTVPLLAGFGLAAQKATGALRRRLPVFTSILLIAVGLVTVAGKWAPWRAASPAAAASAAAPGTATAGAAQGPHACH